MKKRVITFALIMSSISVFAEVGHPVTSMANKPFPLSTVGAVQFKMFDGRTHTCSGVLVGRSIVATAAHCVQEAADSDCVNRDGHNIADQIVFIADPEKGAASMTITVKEITVGTAQFSGFEDAGYDWAILHLAEPLGDTLGFLDLKMPDVKNLPMSNITLAGYPINDQGTGIVGTVVNNCSILQQSDQNYTWGIDCESSVGYSGSPLIFHNEATNKYEVVGLADRTVSSSDLVGNYGFRNPYDIYMPTITVINDSLVKTATLYRTLYDGSPSQNFWQQKLHGTPPRNIMAAKVHSEKRCEK